jgi:aminoglycoside phosphotransferase (APT) family kinase protein
MILKAVLLHKMFRLGSSAITATGTVVRSLRHLPFGGAARSATFAAIRAYQKRFPHAPDAMYRNEVRFYRDVRPNLLLEAPRAFASIYDERARTFAILMEDLTLRSASFPNATMRLDVDRVRALLATLASLHAAFWESPRLGTELRWLATPRSGGMYPVFQALGLDMIRNQIAQNPFKANLIAPLDRTLDELWSALWRLQARLDSPPRTLLHGDPHIGNTYLLPNGDGGFLDWQLMIKGRWAHDVTYVMTTGLAIEDRRTHERDLLRFYLDEVRARGAQSVPTFDEAWADYRRAVAWGLVIGWLITPPENYGETITAANIERLVQAALDLDTFALLA